HAALQVRVAQLTAGCEGELHCGRGSAHSSSVARGIHRDAAIKMSMGRLIILIEIHGSRRCGEMAACRGGQRESTCGFEADGRSIVAEEYLCVSGSRAIAAILRGSCTQHAEIGVAVELRAGGANLDWTSAATAGSGTSCELHIVVEHQKTLLRIIACSDRAAAALRHGKIDALRGGDHAAFLVEGDATGFHVNLAGCRSLHDRSCIATRRRCRERLLRLCFFCNSRRYARTHQRNLDWSGGRGGAHLLVVLELIAGDAVDAPAVCAVEFDLHV